MDPGPRAARRIAGPPSGGATSTSPLCCPSRASLLTGEYAHNHGVLGNTPPEGGFEVFQELHGSSNLATWLHDAGYWTALVGKYFNGYGEDDPGLRPGGLGRVDRQHDARPARLRLHAQPDGRLIDLREQPRRFQGGRAQRRSGPGDRPPGAGRAALLPHARLHGASRRGPERESATATRLHGRGEAGPALRARRSTRPLPTPPGFNERDTSPTSPPGCRNGCRRDRPGRRRELIRRYRCTLESLLAVDDGVAESSPQLRRVGRARRHATRSSPPTTASSSASIGSHREGAPLRAGEPRAAGDPRPGRAPGRGRGSR